MKRIMLHRTKPYTVLCYEALFRALLPQLRENKTLLEDYASYRAGYAGERNADYMVSVYPHKYAYIFQGIRLNNGPFYFQMDTLLVTPMFILILEIKNLKGELEYNARTNQLIQNSGDHRKGQKNPVLQAGMQKRQLMLWLQQNGFPPIPIETAGVSTNQSSILTILEEGEQPARFVQLENLPTIFDNLYQTYTENIYDQTIIRKLNKRLLRENTPYKPDLLNYYRIEERHLAKGIVCENCNHFPMKYQYRKWRCEKCGKTDSKAHEQKILDYFLLFETTITNRVCRELLQISSPKIARRLLYSMNLEFSGKNKLRKYHAPPMEKFPQDSYVPIKKRSVFND